LLGNIQHFMEQMTNSINDWTNSIDKIKAWADVVMKVLKVLIFPFTALFDIISEVSDVMNKGLFATLKGNFDSVKNSIKEFGKDIDTIRGPKMAPEMNFTGEDLIGPEDYPLVSPPKQVEAKTKKGAASKENKQEEYKRQTEGISDRLDELIKLGKQPQEITIKGDNFAGKAVITARH
jgi:hypothetical protein